MSDKSYLDLTDMTPLLEELLRQVNQHKPENPWDYAASYFRKVERCEHVLGADYMTVVACRRNRQAFIYCCSEALRHFPADQRLSVRDFFSLLQLVCPDIPLSLIQDSALTGCTAVGDSPPLYLHRELSTSLFFRFIFTEWLIMLENLFFEGKVRNASITVSLAKLQAKFEEWGECLPASTSQPSLPTLAGVLCDLEAAASVSQAGGVTFDTLISALLRNQGVQEETTSFKPLLVGSSIFLRTPTPVEGADSRMMPPDTSGTTSPPPDSKESVPSLPSAV